MYDVEYKETEDGSRITIKCDFSELLKEVKENYKLHQKIMKEVKEFEDETMELLRKATTEEELKEVNRRLDILKGQEK